MLTPPNDPKAEQAVLGSILIDAWQGIRHLRSVQHIIISPDMFYVGSHRIIWQAMLTLGEALDGRTLASTLAGSGQLDEVGGEAYLLCDLVNAVATASYVEHYARIVARLHYERKIIDEARRIATNPEPSRIEPLRDLVLSREQMIKAAPARDIGAVLGDMVDHLDDPTANKKIMTGYGCWDDIWYGCMPGEVNTWAAATKQGKSVLLLNLMLRAAKSGNRCIFFGTEMSASELSQRMIAIYSGLSARLIRRGLDPTTKERYLTACDELSKLPIAIIDDPEPSLADIEIAVSTHGADILFLDYLERFTMPYAENLRLKIREFMRGIKSLARRRGVLINLASQLNRLSYGREETRPNMSMLSESSAVEKESDRIILLWTPKDQNSEESFVTHIEAIQAGNRHGPSGKPSALTMDRINLRINEVAQVVDNGGDSLYNHGMASTANHDEQK